MSIVIARLLADFALVVLIWMVQLVIYPGFLYYRSENLVDWHNTNTSRIRYIVGPLMLIQLILTTYQLISEPAFFNAAGLLAILAIWAITIIHFVPMHKAITEGELDHNLLNDLVHKNWSRTILWTWVFICSLAQYVF